MEEKNPSIYHMGGCKYGLETNSEDGKAILSEREEREGEEREGKGRDGRRRGGTGIEGGRKFIVLYGLYLQPRRPSRRAESQMPAVRPCWRLWIACPSCPGRPSQIGRRQAMQGRSIHIPNQ